MPRRNYPLTALRAFEAAARHLSFAQAADELHVTPGAVSQQIKTLEEYLDTQLFVRHPNKLELTETAKTFLPKLTEGFLHLDQAVEDIIGDQSSDNLNISVAPIFTAKWLSPRLEKLNTHHPNINFHVSSSLSLVDFNRDAFDAAIRLSAETIPGLVKIKLFDEQLVPMCSPALIQKGEKLRLPDEIGNFTLIHDDSLNSFLGKPGWQAWFEQYAKTAVNWSGGPHFSQPDHAAQSAMDGAGFILGWRNLSDHDLANNRLIAPLNLSIPLGCSFSLVYPEAYAHRNKLIVFQEWLLNEIKIDRS